MNFHNHLKPECPETTNNIRQIYQNIKRNTPKTKRDLNDSYISDILTYTQL
jgi:hypothetical protein